MWLIEIGVYFLLVSKYELPILIVCFLTLKYVLHGTNCSTNSLHTFLTQKFYLSHSKIKNRSNQVLLQIRHKPDSIGPNLANLFRTEISQLISTD